MTKEQFDKAYKLYKEIDFLQKQNNQLQDVINRLQESKKDDIKDIKIQLNDRWVNTPTASIDYNSLFEFLVRQRIKNEEKIEVKTKEFNNI